MTDIRTGNGIDIHRFAEHNEGNSVIILGGHEIPHGSPLLAHSDGDVLTHALMDAILGALALGDIGTHFPDSDPRYKGISSMQLLDKVMAMVKELGWQIGNADITVVAQAPRISPHVERIRENLADSLGTSKELVSVKATTSEGLGFTGRGEGIAVLTNVLLTRS